MTPLRQRMLDDMQVRNFSPHTQRIYLDRVAKFAQYFGKSPDQLGPEEIRAYQVHLIQEKKVGLSLFIQTVCALRFLYQVTLQRDWDVSYCIPFPRTERKLPVILSPTEVARFLDAISNFKYRVLLTTAYSAGLRMSEVLHLRVSDIDSARMLIRVRQGKGRKDRFVMLSDRLLILLREYWRQCAPRRMALPGSGGRSSDDGAYDSGYLQEGRA